MWLRMWSNGRLSRHRWILCSMKGRILTRRKWRRSFPEGSAPWSWAASKLGTNVCFDIENVNLNLYLFFKLQFLFYCFCIRVKCVLVIPTCKHQYKFCLHSQLRLLLSHPHPHPSILCILLQVTCLPMLYNLCVVCYHVGSNILVEQALSISLFLAVFFSIVAMCVLHVNNWICLNYCVPVAST
jgi:hypothetical protein